MTGLSAPFILTLMSSSLPLHLTSAPPHAPLHCLQFMHFSFFFFLDSSFFQPHLDVRVTVRSPPPFHPSPFFFFFFPLPLSKFSIRCPPDSHPSTWVQFKKPFNSCHSTGLAISPAAKAQTGTLLQQATLNVRLAPPIPSRLKVKDSISQRLVQLEGRVTEVEFGGNIATSTLLHPPPRRDTGNIWHALLCSGDK